MSMSVRCDGLRPGVRRAGAACRGLFAGSRRRPRPATCGMLAEVPRFHRAARRAAGHAVTDVGRPSASSSERGGFSRYFASTSSCPLVVRGLVVPHRRPRCATRPATCSRSWTTTGCCRCRARRAGAPWSAARAATSSAPPSELHAVRLSTPVRAVRRTRTQASRSATTPATTVPVRRGGHRHPPRPGAAPARRPDRRRARGARRVPLLPQRDRAAHRRLPCCPAAPAPGRRWNYQLASCEPRSRRGAGQLRHEPAAAAWHAGDDYVVTLNGAGRVDPRRCIARMAYAHPVYTPASVAAQRRLPELNDGRHRVRRRLPRLGLPRGRLPVRRGRGRGRSGGPGERTRAERRLYDALDDQPRPFGRRCGNGFRYRTLPVAGRPRRAAALPRWPRPLARFDARDHLGDPQASIRANVDRFLAARDVDLRGGRVPMLAHARVLGYVFNPLTVYWCHRPDGTLACVVAEVHNTYGDRHCYLLRPDERGRAEVAEGSSTSRRSSRSTARYRMQPARAGRAPRAERRPARPPGRAPVRRQRARPAPSRPPPGRCSAPPPGIPGPQRPSAARIRWHGVQLYLRGLPGSARGPLSYRRRGFSDQHKQRETTAGALDRLTADRWPDVAVAAGSRARAAIARAVFPPRRPGCRCGSSCRTAGSSAAADRPPRSCVLRHPREFFRRLGADGLIGFGESYMAGDWDARRPDRALLAVVRRARRRAGADRGCSGCAAGYVRRQPPDDRQHRRRARGATSTATTTCPTTCSRCSSTRP